MSPGTRTIEQMLADARQGSREALGELMDALWPELRRMAAARMRTERQDHTWQPTALVNELYLELVRSQSLDRGPGLRNDKGAFLSLASRMMMRLLIHHARPLDRRVRRTSIEVEGNAPELCVEESRQVDLLLSGLAEVHPDLRAVVEMKVFEGLSMDEMATRLGCSLRTVERRWMLARRWLETHLP